MGPRNQIERLKERKRFLEVLGTDVIQWGIGMRDSLVDSYPEPSQGPPSIEFFSDVTTAVVAKADRVYLNPSGNVMRCMVCSGDKTSDGKLCSNCKAI